MTFLLDTNTASYIASGRSPQARYRYRQVSRSEVLVSAITAGELRFGLAKRKPGLQTQALLEDFLATVTIAAWDKIAAQTYGPLRAELTTLGQTISALDLLIAAHAIALRATLVTHDRALHRLSPYLSVEDWATDL